MSALPFEPTSVRATAAGLIAMYAQAPLVYTRVRGHLSKAHTDQLMKQVNELLGRKVQVEQFHDWGDMSGYDLMCQKDLTLWTLKVRRNVKRLTILVHSPIVAMGVKVANAALNGMIEICDSRDKFEALLLNRLGDLKTTAPF